MKNTWPNSSERRRVRYQKAVIEMKDHAAWAVAEDYIQLGRTTDRCKVVSMVDAAGWMVD